MSLCVGPLRSKHRGFVYVAAFLLLKEKKKQKINFACKSVHGLELKD